MQMIARCIEKCVSHILEIQICECDGVLLWVSLTGCAIDKADWHRLVLAPSLSVSTWTQMLPDFSM